MYPTEPSTEEELDVQRRYQKLMGDAVNPVLREGNSDRCVAPPVKAYAQQNPHRMGLWSRASCTHVAHMEHGDFYGNEVSTAVPKATTVRIKLHNASDRSVIVLNPEIALDDNEVIDATFISVEALQEYFAQEIEDAKEAELLLSLHLKATMMKVSDPIIFGHCICVYYKVAFDKHADTLENICAIPTQGLNTMYTIIKDKLPENAAKAIIADFEACYEEPRSIPTKGLRTCTHQMISLLTRVCQSLFVTPVRCGIN
jgi:isocitrate dehydrogenase